MVTRTVDTNSGSPPGTTPSDRPARSSRLQSAAAGVVLAALAGLAYWGHTTGWTVAPGTARPAAENALRDEGTATVRVGPEVAGRDDLPPALRRAVAIEFATERDVDRAGIDITPAWTVAVTEAVAASGEVGFDPTRVARLSPRAGGAVWRVLRVAGDRVRAGDALALVDAAAVGRAKAEFQQAVVQARLKRSGAENVRSAGAAVPERQRQEAEAAQQEAEVRLVAAEQALANLGLPARAADYAGVGIEDVVKRMRHLGIPETTPGLAADTATANLLPVRATADGVVFTADAVAGEVVEAGQVLFTVVDPSRVWLTLHVGPDDLRRVGVGRRVVFRPDGVPDDFIGAVVWVGTAADEVTRTVPVRAELANDWGRLRAAMLGKGRIVLREEPAALVVPHEAVRTFRGTTVVFVRDEAFLAPGGPKAFHARPVRTGARDGPNVEIRAGLAKGEVVATRGSGVLLSELQRSSAGETR